jgi:hypothetical protein
VTDENEDELLEPLPEEPYPEGPQDDGKDEEGEGPGLEKLPG